MRNTRIPPNWRRNVDPQGNIHNDPEANAPSPQTKSSLQEASGYLNGLRSRISNRVSGSLPPRSAAVFDKVNAKINRFTDQFMHVVTANGASNFAPHYAPHQAPRPSVPPTYAHMPVPQDVSPAMQREAHEIFVRALRLDIKDVRTVLLGENLVGETPENMLRQWPARDCLAILRQQREILSTSMLEVEKQCIQEFDKKGVLQKDYYPALSARLVRAHKDALSVLEGLESGVKNKLVTDTLGLHGKDGAQALLGRQFANETLERFLQNHKFGDVFQAISAEKLRLVQQTRKMRNLCEQKLARTGLNPQEYADQINIELSKAYVEADAHLTSLQAAAAKASIDHEVNTWGGDLRNMLLGDVLASESPERLLRHYSPENALQIIDQQQALLKMKAVEIRMAWHSQFQARGVPVEAYAEHLDKLIGRSFVQAQAFLTQLRSGVESSNGRDDPMLKFMSEHERKASQFHSRHGGFAGARSELGKLQASLPAKLNKARQELKHDLDSGAIAQTIFERKMKALDDAYTASQAIVDRLNADLDSMAKKAVVDLLLKAKAEGVTIDSSPNELYAAYKKVMFRNHPDRNVNAPDKAEKEAFTKDLSSAWGDFQAREGGSKPR